MTESLPKPEWITTADALHGKIADWLKQDVLALDTEFCRTRTYYAAPGLIQIADKNGAYLIDPIELTDLSPLGALLRAENGPLVIMHSMTEDVLLLQRVTGEFPQRIYDTQVAASFLGESSSLGFQRFISAQLGILLDKNETRSDWLARPLTDEQITYAVQDVVYLLAAFDRQMTEVRARGYFDWVMEECDAWLTQIYASEFELETAYLKVRGAWDLNLLQQKILQRLLIFRDEMARQKDVPKNWVIDDQTLCKIAQREPQTTRDLARIKGIKESGTRRYGDKIISIIVEVQEGHDLSLFQVIDRPIAGREIEVYKTMKRLVERVADRRNISSGLLAPKKQLEQLFFRVCRREEESLTPYFNGWRKHVVGDELLALLLEIKHA